MVCTYPSRASPDCVAPVLWLYVGSPVDIIYLDLKKPLTKCHVIKDYNLNLNLKTHGIAIGNDMINWIEK